MRWEIGLLTAVLACLLCCGNRAIQSNPVPSLSLSSQSARSFVAYRAIETVLPPVAWSTPTPNLATTVIRESARGCRCRGGSSQHARMLMLRKFRRGGLTLSTGQVTARLVLAAVLVAAAATGATAADVSTLHATDARPGSVWRDSAPAESSILRASGGGSEAGVAVAGSGGSFDKADVSPQQPEQQPQQQQEHQQKDVKRCGESDAASPLSFISSNQYPAVEWSPWAQLAEPHREATLLASSMVGDPENDLFMWTLPTENGATYEGRWVGGWVVCVSSDI